MSDPTEASTPTPASPEALAAARTRSSVDTFRVSAKGFRHVFAHHFGAGCKDVESVAYHLGHIEANIGSLREAIRLARYPGAGNRNPKRMALGLVENLSVFENHLREANAALSRLARAHNGGPSKPPMSHSVKPVAAVTAPAVVTPAPAKQTVAKKAVAKKTVSRKTGAKKKSPK